MSRGPSPVPQGADEGACGGPLLLVYQGILSVAREVDDVRDVRNRHDAEPGLDIGIPVVGSSVCGLANRGQKW